jgi:hypothetical protein
MLLRVGRRPMRSCSEKFLIGGAGVSPAPAGVRTNARTTNFLLFMDGWNYFKGYRVQHLPRSGLVILKYVDIS